MTREHEISIPRPMQDAIGPALVRLGSLFPEIEFIQKGITIVVTAAEEIDEPELRKEILNAVYRESIFIRTVNIREKIFG